MSKSPLEHDARQLYRAMTAFLRFHQFRDRDHTGYHGMTITQCYVLECFERRRVLTLNELAAEMLLDKSTLSRIVDGLEARGLLERRANPADGRSQLLSLTPAGVKAYRAVETDLIKENTKLLRQTPAPQRRQFIAMLKRLTQAAVARNVEPLD